jgi:pSer/pThr/pTyr-binding forkhead associated (FHA) protein
MSFLVIARERYPLRIGENMLGGRAAGAVNAPALSALPLFAVITVIPGTPASIRAAGAMPVRVEGFILGSEPRQLSHGARIEVRDCRIRYGELSLVDSTSSVVGILVDDEPRSAIPPVVPDTPADEFGARIIDLGKGSVHGVPPSGLHIGRDPVCQVVIPATAVSRQHALIAPSLHGYIITDRSTNGVLVNGSKVRGSQQLGQGDVIRIGENEFRFEILAPLSQAAPSEVDRRALATLEILSDGPLKGARFPVERPVIHIGRSAENDVRIADDSVSGAHATLLRRGSVWHLIDLASTNGTFVDGRRIDGEAIIQGAAELRFVGVKVSFRPGRSSDAGGDRTESLRRESA